MLLPPFELWSCASLAAVPPNSPLLTSMYPSHLPTCSPVPAGGHRRRGAAAAGAGVNRLPQVGQVPGGHAHAHVALLVSPSCLIRRIPFSLSPAEHRPDVLRHASPLPHASVFLVCMPSHHLPPTRRAWSRWWPCLRRTTRCWRGVQPRCWRARRGPCWGTAATPSALCPTR